MKASRNPFRALLSDTYICNTCRTHLRPRFPPSRRKFSTSSRSPSSDPEIFDVVCVGGGPAGLSLVTALKSKPATSNLRIALVETQDLSRQREWELPPEKFSNRVSSLTPSSRRVLQGMGVWTNLDQSRIQAYHNMQVWDGISGARIEFDGLERPNQGQSHEEGEVSEEGKTIAWMCENTNLSRALLTTLDDLSTMNPVDVESGTKVTSIEHVTAPAEAQDGKMDSLDLSGWPHLTLSNGRTLAARLLVGADGINSPVRTFSGIQTSGWDYDRHGVVATLELSESLEDLLSEDYRYGANIRTAFQRFLPTGPIALLPLPGPFATLVWSTTPSHVSHLKSLAPQDFLASVNAGFRLSTVDINYMSTISSGQDDEFSWREQHTPLPSSIRGTKDVIPPKVVAVQEGSIASFPLKMRHVDTYASPRVALIGDAAHTIHPLAGQGLNMGLGDADSLARTIEYACEHGMDIGDSLSLESYGAERYSTNHRLLGVVDKLHWLYKQQNPGMVGIRSLGLRGVDMLGGLKSFLMKQASGA